MEIYMDELTREFPYELGGDLKYIETIDHGAFGTVIHVIEISSNKDMAVKVINKSGARLSVIKKMKEEISILKQLNHANIVKFFGFLETNNQLLIKMEYIKYGTLSHWIKNHKKISEEEASVILNHILSAVVYLHSKQICHRDIKPENIMLSKENDLHSIKIIDFGLSAQHFDKLINNDYCGTYIYMAPEQIEKKLYFISVDIWSIGILMFILLNNGKHPFYIKGDNKKDFVKKIMDGKINFYNKVSPMAKHLILKLLEPNPSWRYTASQAIKHPWITRNKNDEVPLTFNELLKNSNSKKIAKDLFNVCLFMNYFSKKNKYKFNINQEYIFNCNLYDKKIKEKMNKKKEKCLDILSTDEGDEDSDDNLSSQKKYFPKTREKSYSLNYKNRQSSMIISSHKNILHNKQGELKVNNLKSSKVVSSIFRKFSDKKSLGFKKLSCQPTASSNAKIVSNYKKSIGNKSQLRKKSYNNNLIKSFNITPNKTNQNQNKNQQTSKENNNKDIEKEKEAESKTKYKEENINIKESIINRKEECKSRENIHNDEEEKPEKIYKYYSSKKIRNRLPHIISPQRINYLNLNKQQFSLNDIENYNIVPILLPHIGKIKKEKNNNDNNKRIVKMKLIKNEV